MDKEKKMPLIAEITRLCQKAADELGLELWDVMMAKEGDSRVLRAFIEKDGGVRIDDCEAYSNLLGEMLDAEDPIPYSYMLEVSSPGAERALKTDEHIRRYIGSAVDVRFYKATRGVKSITGVLKAYENGEVTIEADGEDITFSRADAGSIKLHFEF